MGRLFINYRKSESALQAGWLRSLLAKRFGDAWTFQDRKSIPLGTDFEKVIEEQIRGCDVMLAVIGREWLELGRGRAEGGRVDYALTEIERALAVGLRVVPVYVGGARLWGEDEIPETIKSVARLQGFVLRDDFFEEDAQLLIERLTETLAALHGRHTSLKPRPPGLLRIGAWLLPVVLAGAFGWQVWSASSDDDAPTNPANRSEDPGASRRGTASADEIDSSPDETSREPGAYVARKVSGGEPVQPADVELVPDTDGRLSGSRPTDFERDLRGAVFFGDMQVGERIEWHDLGVK